MKTLRQAIIFALTLGNTIGGVSNAEAIPKAPDVGYGADADYDQSVRVKWVLWPKGVLREVVVGYTDVEIITTYGKRQAKVFYTRATGSGKLGSISQALTQPTPGNLWHFFGESDPFCDNYLTRPTIAATAAGLNGKVSDSMISGMKERAASYVKEALSTRVEKDFLLRPGPHTATVEWKDRDGNARDIHGCGGSDTGCFMCISKPK